MINYSFWGVFMFTSICVALCILHFKWLDIWTLITSGLYNNKYSLFTKHIIPALTNLWVEMKSHWHQYPIRIIKPLYISKANLFWSLIKIFLHSSAAVVHSGKPNFMQSCPHPLGYQTCSWSDVGKIAFPPPCVTICLTFLTKTSPLHAVLLLFAMYAIILTGSGDWNMDIFKGVITCINQYK